MTFTHAIRAATVAVALVFTAATVSAQQPPEHQGHKYIGSLHTSQHVDVTTRVDRLDERIAMLTDDMRMFVGEMRIQVMSELIEALIERQYLMERHMQPMREAMDEWMPHATPPGTPGAVPEPREIDPETMCSPFL